MLKSLKYKFKNCEFLTKDVLYRDIVMNIKNSSGHFNDSNLFSEFPLFGALKISADNLTCAIKVEAQ